MASFIDVTGLESFSKIFVFLLVVFAIYVLFIANKWFSSQKWVAAIVAIIVGIFVLLSDLASGVIRHVTPWFAVLFIFVIFIAMASKVFGATASDLGKYTWIIYLIIILIFVVGALSYIRSHTTLPGDQDENGDELKDQSYLTTSNFIFHPKIMGIIFILLVAVFTVALLAGKT